MPVNFNINNLFGQLGKGWTIVFILLIITGVFFYFTKKTTFTTVQNCTECERDKQALVDVLVDLKKDMTKLATPNDHTSNIHFNSGEALLFPYLIDTTKPKKALKKRVTTNVQIQQQQQIAVKDLKKIDSILKFIQQQQSQKPKQ